MEHSSENLKTTETELYKLFDDFIAKFDDLIERQPVAEEICKILLAQRTSQNIPLITNYPQLKELIRVLNTIDFN